MTLVLSHSDVEDLLDLDQAMACLRRAFVQQGLGTVEACPPSLLHSGGSFLRVTQGGLSQQGRMGLRVNSGPQGNGAALLYDSPGGDLLSLMAYPFAGLRLSATVALGLDLLASVEAQHVGLLGTGSNAMGLLRGVAAVRPITSVVVYGPHEGRRTAFAESASASLEVQVLAAAEAQDAVAGADIVVVATNSTSPALRGGWLMPGACVASTGRRTELDQEVFRRAERIVTTSRLQEMNPNELSEDWPLVGLVRAGEIDMATDVLELGQVVTGGGDHGPGISLFRDAQGGFGDVALAAHLYESAEALGRGTRVRIN